MKEVAKDKKEIKGNSVKGERRQGKNNVFLIPAVDGDVITSTFEDKHPSICVYDGDVNEKVAGKQSSKSVRSNLKMQRCDTRILESDDSLSSSAYIAENPCNTDVDELKMKTSSYNTGDYRNNEIEKLHDNSKDSQYDSVNDCETGDGDETSNTDNSDERSADAENNNEIARPQVHPYLRTNFA